MEYKEIRIKGRVEVENIEIAKGDLIDVVKSSKGELLIGKWNKLVVRSSGVFANKAIYLPETLDYLIGKDEMGCKILVPTIKKKDADD